MEEVRDERDTEERQKSVDESEGQGKQELARALKKAKDFKQESQQSQRCLCRRGAHKGKGCRPPMNQSVSECQAEERGGLGGWQRKALRGCEAGH